MLWANSSNGERIEASPSGEGYCSGCKSRLIPKCGEIVIWHWAHYAGDCDPWYEPESRWHLSWKSLVRPSAQEVAIGCHRADIVGNRGVVIELQHSSIAIEAAREREAFYGNMVWVFDGREFERNLSFRSGKSQNPNYASFRWKYPRWTHTLLTRPVFWDFDPDGEWLFEVRLVHDDTPCGGWGFWYPRKQFVEKYLSSVMKKPEAAIVQPDLFEEDVFLR